MPVFEVERNGRTFEVDAPTAQAAVEGVKRLGSQTSSSPSNVGGLPENASLVDFAAQSFQVANAEVPQAPADPNTPEGFAQLRARANQQLMDAQPEPPAPPQFGDSLKPIFGGHNPIAETYGAVIDPFIPTAPRSEGERSRAEWLNQRGYGERAADTAAFVASMPVRIATQGHYGAGDALSAIGFPNAGQSVSNAEGDFARANAPQLEAIQTVGDAALGAFGANAQPFPRTPGRSNPRALRAGATERAQSAASDLMSFENAEVPVFSPAFGSTMTQATAKGLSDTFGVGAPLQDALESSYRGVRDAAQRVAEGFGEARTAKEVGDAVGAGIERFKDWRSTDMVEDSVARLPDNRLSEIISAPTSSTSVKTKQGALYERAWRQIPEEMRAGRSVEGLTRVMGSPEQTRNVLSAIHDRHRRMTLQSGTNAAPDAATRPIQGGGLLARMTDALMHPRWTANLQTLRDMRSEFRRLASGMADTEKNVLKHSDIDRVQSAITHDMIALLQRNADAYRQQGTTGALRTAEGFERSIREFRRADRFTRLSMERLDSVERLFKAESSEALARNITTAALAGGKGNTELLRSMHRILRPDELGEVAAGVLSEMGRPTGSARGLVQELGFSVESFTTRWNNMTPEARGLLFGHQHAKALNDLVAVSRRLANVESFANRSNTFRSGGNALGIAATVGTAVSGGFGGLAYLAGAVGSTYGLSYLLSRPAYARWATRYLQLKAATDRGAKASARTALVRHVGELAKAARNDPALASIIASVATQERIPLNEVSDLISGSDIAGGQGAAGPRAELRSYTPSPSENAAFYTRQGAEALGIPSSQAERIGSGAGALVNAFTPADDIADALETGSAASAAAAGLSFIPGFRGGKKAVEVALTKVRKELAELEAEAARLFGEARTARIMGPNPVPDIPGREIPTDTLLQSAERQKQKLQEAIEGRRSELAARPQSPTSVPATTSDQQRALERSIDGNPFVQAIPGRQGFPKKEEQKKLVREFFESGETLPAAPWGRDAVSDVKHALASAHARGKAVSAQDASAIENAAKKASKAADEARELQLFAEASPNGTKELSARLAKAETEAKHWEQQYNMLWRKLFGED
jgi:hypothetical protein